MQLSPRQSPLQLQAQSAFLYQHRGCIGGDLPHHADVLAPSSDGCFLPCAEKGARRDASQGMKLVALRSGLQAKSGSSRAEVARGTCSAAARRQQGRLLSWERSVAPADMAVRHARARLNCPAPAQHLP